MTTPRSTLALTALHVASYHRSQVHNTVQGTCTVRTQRLVRQRDELIGAARLDLVVATTNPAKGVR